MILFPLFLGQVKERSQGEREESCCLQRQVVLKETQPHSDSVGKVCIIEGHLDSQSCSLSKRHTNQTQESRRERREGMQKSKVARMSMENTRRKLLKEGLILR